MNTLWGEQGNSMLYNVAEPIKGYNEWLRNYNMTPLQKANNFLNSHTYGVSNSVTQNALKSALEPISLTTNTTNTFWSDALNRGKEAFNNASSWWQNNGGQVQDALNTGLALYDAYSKYKNYKLGKEAYNLQRDIALRNLDMQRQEYERLKQQRRGITRAYGG